MKKVITLSITAIFCIAFAANAQINKGSIMLGGILGGSFNNVKNPDTVAIKTTTVSIQPAIGFAVDTNTIVGFSLLYANETNKYYAVDRKNKSFGAGVFARKYKPLGKNFYFFGDGGLLYYHSDYNYSSQNPVEYEYDSKSNTVNLYISPGISYNLTRSVQFEAGLQNLLSIIYSSANEKAKTPGDLDYKLNNFAFSSFLNPVSLSGIFVGVRFLFNK